MRVFGDAGSSGDDGREGAGGLTDRTTIKYLPRTTEAVAAGGFHATV